MNVTFDPTDLKPIIDLAVETAIQRLDDQRAKFSDRIAFAQPEAARLLGVKPHVLRDLRRRGKIEASKIGTRYFYERDELINYLRRNRVTD